MIAWQFPRGGYGACIQYVSYGETHIPLSAQVQVLMLFSACIKLNFFFILELHLDNEMTPQQLLLEISCCNVALVVKRFRDKYFYY